MIAGAVEPPAFTIDNERILRRQINSLVLEKLDFQFRQKLGEHYPEDEAEEFELPGVEAEVQAKREKVIAAVLKAFNKDKLEPDKQAGLAWLNRTEVSQIVDGYYPALVAAFQPWLTERDAVFGEIVNLSTEMARVGRRDPRAAAAMSQRIQHLYKLLDQIDGRYPLSYLSDQGFLPSYAFPSDTARLLAKDEVKRPVTRGMGLALTEYAPGNKVYMDRRKYQVIGLDFHRTAIPDLDKTYKHCDGCDYATLEPMATHCPHCGQMLSPQSDHIMFASSFVAERAEAIGSDEEYRERAFYGGKTYLLRVPEGGEERSLQGMALQYHRSGEILSVNTGLPKNEGRGFMICRSCGYWQSPTSKADFSDHKLLHNRREVCGGNGEYFHLGHRFHTDVLLLRFEGVAGQPTEFFASLKAAMIEAANSVAQAEGGEIAGFTRLVTEAGQDRQDLVLYDNVPGGAGYVRAAAAQFEEVLRVARTLLDGCQCEKSCYKCLRSYRNQFEHKLLDKRLIAPYLDSLIVANSVQEQARLAVFGADTQRYFGSNPSLWLQRQVAGQGGDLLAVCDSLDDAEVTPGTPWSEFLVSYAKDHPDRRLEIGLTHVPSLDQLTEHNLLAVKQLLDLLDAGVHLYQVAEPDPGSWHVAVGQDGAGTVVAVLDEVLSLSVHLNHQAVVYNDTPACVDAARARIRLLMQAGRPITSAAFRVLNDHTFRVRDIQDREPDVTYQALFGEYLAGAKWLKIVDPYVRQAYQVDNLKEFLQTVSLGSPCRVELVTMYAERLRYGGSGEGESRQRLDELERELSAGGKIQFSYVFDPTIHDRQIETSVWQIIPGRGLDIYYPEEGGQRLARPCRIVYLRK